MSTLTIRAQAYALGLFLTLVVAAHAGGHHGSVRPASSAGYMLAVG